VISTLGLTVAVWGSVALLAVVFGYLVRALVRDVALVG